MKNIQMQRVGNDLIIKVDITKDFGPSKSGKTVIIASTEGNEKLDGMMIGVNVYRYPEAA